MTDTTTSNGESFLYLINLDDIEKDFNVFKNGKAMIPGRKIHLPANEVLTLPINIDIGFGIICYVTIEIYRRENNAVVFRNTEKFSSIAIRTNRKLKFETYINSTYQNGTYLIQTDNRLLEDEIVISFE